MNISKRLNVVQGRHADSWTRVIGGRLFLFVHGHSPTAGGNTRANMVTHNVSAWELEWEDFETLADVADFTTPHGRREGSTLRHMWRA